MFAFFKKCFVGLILFIFCLVAHANETQKAYLTQFMAYLYWSEHLPLTPEPSFILFIDSSSPLTNKLREKWLYQLALQKKWPEFTQYYRSSADVSLQCYAEMALTLQGETQKAMANTIKLWLTGNSQPPACDALFTLFLTQHLLTDELIQERIILALEKNNTKLVVHLLKQLPTAADDEMKTFSLIMRQPTAIMQLTLTPLHRAFYLFGLNRMVPQHMTQAEKIWQMPRTQQFLTPSQQQAFIARMAFYKAMRNQSDAPRWFARLDSKHDTGLVLDWHIRYALRHKQWKKVIQLIHQSSDQNTPEWQYWQARAYQKLNESEKAHELFQILALKRTYYGFLASLRLHQLPQFEDHSTPLTPHALDDYQPFLDQIKTLYQHQQTATASRQLNDFNLQLPLNDQVALAYWLIQELNWPFKAIYLSNNENVNNQLLLRFPLAFHDSIQSSAQRYHVPEALIYAIIRQESAFRTDIISPAGAQGIMQIMPQTAKCVAKRAHILFDDTQLFEPQKNIDIGVAYLHQLAPTFKSHPLFMAAAYNAGPRQVRRWQQHAVDDLDIWIDTLPWIETRNYIKNIFSFYVIYQYRMHHKVDLMQLLEFR